MEAFERKLALKYTSDLTDEQWAQLAPWFGTKPRQRGRKAIIPRQRIVEAIFYIQREDIPWHLLPDEYPNWRVVYSNFNLWRHRGYFVKAFQSLFQADEEG